MADGRKPVEDLDQMPSKFHELNNAIHSVAVTTAVIKTNIDSQREQSGRIEMAISSVNSRLDRFDVRMNDIEKTQVSVRGELEKQIATVKSEVQSQMSGVSSDLQSQVARVSSEFREGMAILSPVRLLVYGALTLLLTAFANVLITRTMIQQQAPSMMQAPREP